VNKKNEMNNKRFLVINDGKLKNFMRCLTDCEIEKRKTAAPEETLHEEWGRNMIGP